MNLFEPVNNSTSSNGNGVGNNWKKRTKKSADAEREQQQQRENDELFVFGYACKLFRDDTTALKLDSDSHLIPWNGDTNLLIDRYDCRGYLYDLNECDADLIKRKELNDEDKEIEMLCDEERYLALNKCIEEEALYQEEEMKRFYAEQQEFGAVGMSYDDQQATTQTTPSVDTEPKETVEEPEKKSKLESFVPSEQLKLPVGMFIPETRKQNVIIEKTASFVSKSGLQMEIVLKAKQATNHQFNFLNFDDSLNPYYKHLVSLIKAGKYEPKFEDSDDDQSGNSSENDSDDDNYLHPSLSKALAKPVTPVADIPAFKPNIKDTAYSHLIQKFADYSAKMQKETPPPPPPQTQQPQTQQNQSQLDLLNLTSLVNPPPPPPPPPTPQVQAVPVTTIEEQIKLPEHINAPTPELKTVIDKLADYVSRNGPNFEECIRRKNDPRFEFLDKNHPNHSYYQFKLKYFHDLKKARQLAEKLARAENHSMNENSNSSLTSQQSENSDENKLSTNNNTNENKKNSNDSIDVDTDENANDSFDTDGKNDNFSKEQQAKRKLKAALFLNKLKSQNLIQSVDTEAVNDINKANTATSLSNNGEQRVNVSESNDDKRTTSNKDSKTRSRSRSRSRHHRSRSRDRRKKRSHSNSSRYRRSHRHRSSRSRSRSNSRSRRSRRKHSRHRRSKHHKEKRSCPHGHHSRSRCSRCRNTRSRSRHHSKHRHRRHSSSSGSSSSSSKHENKSP